MTILLSVSLTACGGKSESPQQTQSVTETVTNENPAAVPVAEMYEAKPDQLISSADTETETEAEPMSVAPIEDPVLEQNTSSEDASSEPDPAPEPEKEPEKEPTPTKTQKKEIIHNEPDAYRFYDNWLWVGDSRMIGMTQAVNIKSYAKSDADLNWFKENSETLYTYMNTTIVINIGLCDMNNIQKYIDTFNAMPAEFVKNNCIYFMSVNPVNEEMEAQTGAGSYKNKMIENFNNALKANLRSDVYFIDMYSYLQEHGFTTLDGVVYDDDTNAMIHDRLLATIGA